MWYDRTLQAWWDLSLAGDYLYMYALTDPEDGLSYPQASSKAPSQERRC